MLIKKTKSGKFSCGMSYELRDELFSAIINFLEDDWITFIRPKLKSKDDVMHCLYSSVLNSFLSRTDFKLQTNSEASIILSRAEAVAVMFLIRDYSKMEMINLKGVLHKLFC